MYCIVVYDVNSKRVSKVLKHFRRYLVRIQNSVFEGEISEGKYKQMYKEVLPLINKKEDSITFFLFSSNKYLTKKTIGKPIAEVKSVI